MITRLISLDMDGTLLTSNHEIPADFEPWVLAHPEALVMVSSGRQVYTLEKMFPALHDRLLFSADNGALVMYRDEVLMRETLPKETVRRVIDALRLLPGVRPILCGVETAWCDPSLNDERMNAARYYVRLREVDRLEDALEQDEIIKLAVYFEKFDAEDYLPRLRAIDPEIEPLLTYPCWVDMMSRRASKGGAIRFAAEKWQLKKENCWGFGDYLNDLSMIGECGRFFAMGNAHPLLKEKATDVCGSNNENGVMRVLHGLD